MFVKVRIMNSLHGDIVGYLLNYLSFKDQLSFAATSRENRARALKFAPKSLQTERGWSPQNTLTWHRYAMILTSRALSKALLMEKPLCSRGLVALNASQGVQSNDAHLERLSEECSCIHRFALYSLSPGGFGFSAQAFKDLFKKHPEIQSVRLDGCYKISDEELPDVIASLEAPKKIRIWREALSENTLQALKEKLPASVERLTLICLRGPTAEAAQKTLALPHLKRGTISVLEANILYSKMTSPSR